MFEMMWLTIFLPALQPLTLSSFGSLSSMMQSLSLVDTPTPVLAWSYRWLLFRLMFGFGKLKFGSKSDQGYTKPFLVNQPIPSPLGWYGHHLPLIIHKISLVLMFIAEIPIPFCIFANGSWRLIAALATIALQVLLLYLIPLINVLDVISSYVMCPRLVFK
jgi:hypothetical protein